MCGTSAAGLLEEAVQHENGWDYVQWADRLHTRSVLLVEAYDQNRAAMEALAVALRRSGSAALEQRALPTDHSFSDHRIELQAVVINWLERLQK